MINGILLVDKAVGWTSFDAVARIRSIVSKNESKRVKVGHSGTLDPFATGLLQIFIGTYTKRVQEFIKQDKTYDVEMELGKTSTTGDPEGSFQVISSKKPDLESIENSLNKFTGEYLQSPPIFSAIKVAGKKAYELARKGESVKLERRLVKIYSTKLLSYSYPYVRFTVRVSSGTYIRSLVQDIGDDLGVGAYTKQLRRTSIGDTLVTDALTIDKCNMEEIERKLIQLV